MTGWWCLRLFQFADGRAEWLRVDTDLPRVWVMRDMPPPASESFAEFLLTGAPLHVVERTFYRRDYRYHEDFIGPRIYELYREGLS